GDPQAALAGLKVLDLMWVFAGPLATRTLADFGATVIRVESSHAIDAARTINPAMDGVAGPERAAGFINVNAGKLGISVNIATEEGRAVIRRLAKWADVLTESFSPKAMKKWGLDYETLSADNPGLIMLSSCLNGQTGPWSRLAGFGTMGAQLAGFGELAGWPDRAPAGMFGAYTDYVAPKFTVAAILAAVEERRSSGRGQYIDLSQAEASLHFLTPGFLEYGVNGRVMRRIGNASDWWAPQGLYPCSGEDKWGAIACETAEQWRSLASAAGHPEWLADARFATNADRMANRGPLDDLIAGWTATHSQGEVEAALQAAGVPVHRSAASEDAFADPHLIARNQFPLVQHAELGEVPVEGPRFRLSATPAKLTRGGATLGQDTDYVLREILGLGDGEIVELISAGALE
ncbi:MAG: CaiB/BaiF CoA transferase family protein, partial [Dehalococcoidia bacterium]